MWFCVLLQLILVKNKAKYGGHFEIQNGRWRHTRKKWKQLSFCSLEYKEGKKHWFHQFSKFCTGLHNPMYYYRKWLRRTRVKDYFEEIMPNSFSFKERYFTSEIDQCRTIVSKTYSLTIFVQVFMKFEKVIRSSENWEVTLSNSQVT